MTANIVQIPIEDPEGERNRRVMAEVTRLSNLAPGEWKLWAPKRANELGIELTLLTDLIETQLKDDAERARKAQAEARLGEQRAHRLRQTDRDRQREQQRIEEAAEKKGKEKSKAFSDIIKLPSDQQEVEVTSLAKKLGIDVAALRAEFSELAAAETSSSSGAESDVEPWPEPVATAAVLEELITRINQHVKAKPHEVLAVALWVLMAWVHEVAAHYSIYLVATSPKDNCGKTTLIVEVVGQLVPKPYVSGSNPTEASIFRLADREKPSMMFDNVDTLFQRKPEVTDLFLHGWTRGVKVPRSERIGKDWVTVLFDPFCPKACSLIGTNLPPALLGRCLLIELWPLKPGEEVVEVDPHDEELTAEFETLKRKLLRWSLDNDATLKSAKPLYPAGFVGRPRNNAKLLLAIAELANDSWAEQARAAIDKLLREKREPSWLEMLLQEMWSIFVKDGRKAVTSKQLLARLTADPTSEWYEYGTRAHRVTEREVAFLLRKLHIRPHLIGKTRIRGYRRQDFLEKEIFQHFLGRDPLILSPDTQQKKRPRSRKKKRG